MAVFGSFFSQFIFFDIPQSWGEGTNYYVVRLCLWRSRHPWAHPSQRNALPRSNFDRDPLIERERKRERKREREREGEREGGRERGRKRERETERERMNERDREGRRETE